MGYLVFKVTASGTVMHIQWPLDGKDPAAVRVVALAYFTAQGWTLGSMP